MVKGSERSAITVNRSFSSGLVQVNGLEKSNLEAGKIGHILDRMMIA